MTVNGIDATVTAIDVTVTEIDATEAMPRYAVDDVYFTSNYLLVLEPISYNKTYSQIILGK